MNTVYFYAGAVLALASSTAVSAHDVYADDHAPIGVMADHTHKAGEFMLSARAMHMDMGGNRIGTDPIDPDTIVTTIPNRFAGMPGQPPTLRIVPTDMRADMVMVGAMYAPIDAVTFAVMGSYIQKEMDALAYQGGMGTTVLGGFSTSPEGFGDIKVAALFPLIGKGEPGGEARQNLTAKLGVSIPTGSLTQTAQVLTPMGDTPTMQVPYGMQPGSGTWDVEPALTYKVIHGRLGMGVQGSAKIRTGTNDQGYSLGDVYEGTAWVSYRPAQWLSFSGRALARTTGQIDGMNPAIMGPVQSANPDFSGGERVDLLAGINTVVTHGSLAGHRLGVELGVPVYQDLNGPQMEGDWSLTVGWQKSF